MHTQQVTATAAVNSTEYMNNEQFHRWSFWCRLCAKEDFNGNINIILKDEQMATNKNNLMGVLCLSEAIHKFFSIDLNEELLPKMLCKECFSLITSLINFTDRISRVQRMFNNLATISESDNIDVNSIRLKYGLLDEEREHIVMPYVLPEVHYFEAKPKINDLNNFDTEVENIIANPLEQATVPVNIKRENVIEQQIENVEVDKDPFNEDGNNSTENHANNLLELDSNSSEENCDSDKERSSGGIETPFRKMKSVKKTNKSKLHKGVKKTSKSTSVKSSDSEDADEISKNDSLASKRQYESQTCSECPRKFKRIQQYRQHMERVHGKVLPKDTLTCSECNRSFTTKYQLERHSKIHLPIQHKKVIPCPYCTKKFASNTSVQTHIKYIHMNERPFICEECGVAVRTNAALKTHMLTHTDYAPFICDICKKGFKSQIRLKNHLETHDPNKHICAECGLQLNSRATLNRHLLVHSDEMQHKCDYCGRAFKRVKALKNHLILHTGLKPYSCDFCDRTFANGSNCRSHKKKAHPKELAALEASGGGKQYTRNIPKLETLKAVTKATDNLAPVVSKQSGCFAFGKKPKPQVIKSKPSKTITNPLSTTDNSSAISGGNSQVDFHHLNSVDPLAGPSIPTIDNIYSHIMKKTTTMSHESSNILSSNLTSKRLTMQNASCIRIDHDSNASDIPSQQMQHHHHINSQLHSDHAQMGHGPFSGASFSANNFYNQIMKHSGMSSDSPMTIPLTTSALQIHEVIRSPDADSQNSFITATDEQSNVSSNFFLREGPFL